MTFLRRLLGGGRDGANEGAVERGSAIQSTAEQVDAEERARELELLRAEQERLGELVLRQQRYADRSWVPPSQGGPRRSDDGEAAPDRDR